MGIVAAVSARPTEVTHSHVPHKCYITTPVPRVRRKTGVVIIKQVE
jgi:hypothetical protein